MNKDKKQMLYIMHVSWYWIKQRPQFLAINLCNHFNIKILYKKSFTEFTNYTKVPDNCIGIYQLPFSRFPVIQYINDSIYRWVIKKYLRDINFLWLSSPTDYSLISDLISPIIKIVYDCMDDICEFPQYKKEPYASKIIYCEGLLVDRANSIIVSSNWLKHVIIKRYKTEKDIHIINNALDQNFLCNPVSTKKISYPPKQYYTDIMYIGTISEWFNFNLIQKGLSKYSDLRLILVGPSSFPIPKNNRIIHLGSKEHSELPSYMAQADALIMPFIVNDLILSVNPVKLYEYIYSGKPIITCNYKEIEQFKEFVFPYDNDEDFIIIINKLILKQLNIKSEEERIKFLYGNTWKERSLEIIKIICNETVIVE